MKLLILLLSVVEFSCSNQSALTFKNSTEDFDRFWHDSEKKTPTKRFNKFKSTAYKSFPEFYDYKFDQWKKNGHDPIDSLSKEIDEYPNYRATFLAIGKKLPSFLEGSALSFKKMFPDFNENIEVHIINSFGDLDGGTRILDNRLYFIFGAKSIAKYHKNSDMERKVPFFHHELFHMYHRQFFQEGDRIYSSLWVEGLAVLAAEALNPHATKAELSLDNPNDLMKTCDLLMPRLIDDITPKLMSNKVEDYGTYFYGSSKHEWIPKRAGYCIGYKIAKFASKSHPTQTLAKLHDAEVLAIIKNALNELAR